MENKSTSSFFLLLFAILLTNCNHNNEKLTVDNFCWLEYSFCPGGDSLRINLKRYFEINNNKARIALGDKFKGYEYFDVALNDTLLNEISLISKISKNYFVEKFYNYSQTTTYDGNYYSVSISTNSYKKMIVYYIPSDLPENLCNLNNKILKSFTASQKKIIKEFDFDSVLIKTININLYRIYHFPKRLNIEK